LHTYVQAQVKWDRDTGSWVSIAEPVGIREYLHTNVYTYI